MKVRIPYGKSSIFCDVPDFRLKGILGDVTHGAASHRPAEADLVRGALDAPIGSMPLRELAKGKKRVVLITSDHTRPVPSRITMPVLLKEIREGSPDADVTVLVATGMHRGMRREEIDDRFGPALSKEKIVVHDCHDEANLVSLGTLPSGGELVLNRMAAECDLLLAEGFIEPHFFAGFSGGRKAVLPGVAGYRSVLANHCAEFIAHERTRAGILDGNPIHEDMIFAARAARLAFIMNVVLDPDKKIIAAFAGDADKAHREGCGYLKNLAGAKAVPADIVVTGNGGYPLDQNLYQAVKGMTGAEMSLVPGGVIVMAAECRDGHGGEDFYGTFKDTQSPEEAMRAILARGRGETLPDQWQTQIFLRVLAKHKVIMVSSVTPEMIEHLGMIPAPSLDAAIEKAGEILGKKDASVTVIPDGVSVILE